MGQNKSITKMETDADVAELFAAYCMPDNELIELLDALLAAHLENIGITKYTVSIEEKYE